MNPPQTDTVTDASLYKQVRFILVETSRAGNIGAAARAMKTMGFSELVLVNPRCAEPARHEEAVAFASGAQDVLEGARIVATLEEALTGCNFAAAVSARLREYSPPVVTPRQLAAQLLALVQAGGESKEGTAAGPMQAALLFGNERFGLPNEAVARCNALINIPANPAYSSLNLAQAVQVLAYECRMAFTEGRLADSVIGFRGDAASLAQVEGMYAHLEQALVAIDFLNPDTPKKLMPRLKRMFARSGLETEEVNILRGMARQMLLLAQANSKQEKGK